MVPRRNTALLVVYLLLAVLNSFQLPLESMQQWWTACLVVKPRSVVLSYQNETVQAICG